MPSVIHARHLRPGFNRYRRWRRGPRWETRIMARALTEGWLIDDPDKLRELREEMYRIATGKALDDPRKYGPADRIAAYRALQENVKTALAERKQEQEKTDPAAKPELVKVLRGVSMDDL